MKRHTVVLIAAAMMAVAPHSLLSQAKGSDATIALIRTRFAQITREVPTYQKVVADLDSLGFERSSTDGASVNAYFAGSSLRRAEVTYFGEHGSSVWDIYYWEGVPFFCHITDRTSGEVLYGPQRIEGERRVYLNGKTVARYMEGQKIVSSSEMISRKSGKEVYELAMQILRTVKARS